MLRWFPAVLLVLVSGLLLASVARAELTVPSFFSDHMVLQRDQPLPVWGTAAAGEKITVTLAEDKLVSLASRPGISASAVADAAGAWRVTLPAQSATPAGQSMVLTIAGAGQPVVIRDVLVGEVWIGSGQSNMEMLVMNSQNAEQEVNSSDLPQVRMFTVMHAVSPTPLTTCDGQWRVAGPDTTGAMSATGFFFARALHAALKVPVGILSTSWGGTPIQPWISLPVLQAMPAMQARIANVEKARGTFDLEKYQKARSEAVAKYREKLTAWQTKIDAADPAMAAQWYLPTTDTGAWKEVHFPGQFQGDLYCYSGFVWARKDVTIPAAWVGQDLQLGLGAIDECDISYVNGVQVGQMWFDTPNMWLTPRLYPVPAALVKSTTLSIVVRIFNCVGDVGPLGPGNKMFVLPAKPAPGTTPVALAGAWRVCKGLPVAAKDAVMFGYPDPPGANASEPSCLYNGMIAPLVPYAVRGAIWYQGESNSGEPDLYRQLLPALIGDWRHAWGHDLAFGIVQLAGFQAVQTLPVEKQGWADLREAQRQTALTVPTTGLAAATDIGDSGNIHPRNKQEVGRRLALWALATVYGQKLEYSGPTFAALKVEGDALRVTLDHAQGLKALGGGAPVGFAIAGADKVFHWATGTIDGQSVLLRSAAVPAPVAVRYAWANLPVCNLVNGDGLPAVAFRSDDWDAKDIAAATDEPVPALPK